MPAEEDSTYPGWRTCFASSRVRDMSTDVAPGWYADPQAQGQLRYWDGNTWTEHTQPATEQQPTPAPQQQVAEPPPQQQQQAAPAGVDQHAPAYHAGSLEGITEHGRERIEQLKGSFFKIGRASCR